MTGRTQANGYGAAHKALRLQWAVLVAEGAVMCWRCGSRIAPGAAWDLGHADGDKSRYAGPEHRSCSRRSVPRRDPPPLPPRTAW